MALIVGSRIGPYTITAAIGAGGMGEVYAATDTKLKRQVAIKVLPAALAADADRLARFQREAEVLAALNHSNIAAIYGLEESPDAKALVMELVEGSTLADRIAQGPMSLDDALPIAVQIAHALEAAHEQGIIHRDLKPANIKVRDDGAVKVLDFGLAKALESGARSPQASSPKSQDSEPETQNLDPPTITSPALTRMGVILGTAAYMSPEQAKGRPADKRSDIWSFGCVLYEMLTGRRLFPGDDLAETLASVLRAEPDWRALPTTTPTHVRDILARCLDRDRAVRIPDGAALRFLLTTEPRTDGAAAPGARSRAATAFTAAAVATLVTALAAPAIWRLAPVPEGGSPVFSFIVPPPEGGTFALGDITPWPAISPDGETLAFAAAVEGRRTLWVRPLSSTAARSLAGTEGAGAPFWSPDSRQVGFFAGGELKVADLSGERPPRTLARLPSGTPRAATWGRDGTILFGCVGCPIYRVADQGGEPTPVSRVDEAAGETGHYYPSFLPDSRHFLYVVQQARSDVNETRIGDLGSPETTTVLQVNSEARYSPTGHLLYARDGTLVAHRFDLSRLELAGEPTTVAERVVRYSGNAGATFSISNTGVLVYRSGGDLDEARLAWFDRTGRELGTLGTRGFYSSVEFSPDGSSLAATVGKSPSSDLWVLDRKRGTSTALTLTHAGSNSAHWTSDGASLIYEGPSGLRRLTVGGATADEGLFDVDPGALAPCDVAPDGEMVAYTSLGNIWLLPLGGGRKPFQYSQTDAVELHCQIDPTGRWIAYAARQGERSEVYVDSFPTPGARRQVSAGSEPRWRADGKELYFMAGDTLMAASLRVSATEVESDTPRPLFEAPVFSQGTLAGRRRYDVTDGGRQFLFIVPAERSEAPLTVVTNWPAAFTR